MPYDSVYSEKRLPGTLRTARRKFYSDASDGRLRSRQKGLAVLCIFWRLVCALRHRPAISRLPIIAAVMVALWRSFFLHGD